MSRKPSRTPSRTPSRRPAAVLALLTLVLALLTAAPAASASAPRVRAIHYVALGDSAAAAPGVPRQADAHCMRSDHSYPYLVARRLHPATFRDVSCSGASTATIRSRQLSAVRADTTLVTLTTGGNDVGYARIIARCSLLGALQASGAPCRARYSHGPNALAGRVAAAEPRIIDLLRQIHRRAPHARVYLVGYLKLLPADHHGCRPRELFGDGDLAYLGAFEDDVNAMLRRAAARGGAVFVDNHPASARHDICEPRDVRWSEALLPTNPTLPFHPNAHGEHAMADATLTAVGRDALHR